MKSFGLSLVTVSAHLTAERDEEKCSYATAKLQRSLIMVKSTLKMVSLRLQ